MLLTRKSQAINYSVSGGDTSFSSVTCGRQAATIQICYTGIDTEDVTISIEQSVNGSKFDVITGAIKALDSTKGSHTFNIVGLRTDRIRVVLAQGTATTGTIDDIYYIFQ